MIVILTNCDGLVCSVLTGVDAEGVRAATVSVRVAMIEADYDAEEAATALELYPRDLWDEDNMVVALCEKRLGAVVAKYAKVPVWPE